MKRFGRKGLSLLLALVMLLSFAVPAAAADSSLEKAVQRSAAYMQTAVKAPQVGSIGGEWAVIGLARSGAAVPQSYWDNYYAAAESYVKACGGVLHEKKYTEYSRLIVALTSIGADPANVAGYNLLTPLGDFDKTIWQGINGPVWALIALDCGSYDLPVNPSAAKQATRQMYVDEILSRQLDDGGWNLTDKGGSGKADPDMTGMVLQALAGYQAQSAVKSATDKALSCLSTMQDATGGFTSWGSGNAESTAQVITALCALGIDLNDSRFVNGGHSLLDDLLSYQQSDGSFLHTHSGSASQMASEQGLYALAAALRSAKGQSSLYRMDDVSISVTGVSIGLPNKHADVKRVPITAPGSSFTDVAAHKNQSAIEAMAARGIINGMGNGKFAPDANMTRAEFSAIVVRALGLTPKSSDSFTDVSAKKWYAPYIGTASAYGLINGIGNGKFAPESTITRQEAAVLVARAAALCGMDTTLDINAVRDILAQFTDYVTSADWARPGLAFCYGSGILDDSALDIQPKTAIKRCEIAQMLYNLLDRANLL